MPSENDTRQRVREMLEMGMTVRQIAAALGLTTQAIYVQKHKIEKESAA